ncbi:MAG: SDR family oxidoreductase [Cyclobacteriaceae bacterium]|jgi:enoyl-[acyl-carrier protein] reductase III|nr:SDR family oxidoreductase [Cyclobacteriaceae bacterium]
MSKIYNGDRPYAVILGGSSGIGLATVKKLANSGFNIVSIYRERRSGQKKLESIFENIRQQGSEVLAYNLNALKKETMDAVVSDIQSAIGTKSVKLLLHSIANGNLKPLRMSVDKIEQDIPSLDENESYKLFAELKRRTLEQQKFLKRLSVDDFNYTINAMATSLLDWSNAFLDGELFMKNARILGLTSEGNKKVWRGYAAVSSAKVVLESLVQHMALEYAPLGITANLIQAGVTDTPSLRMIPGSEVMMASSITRNPFGRLTTPEDIANIIYLLSRDEASWINGTTIVADGGEHLCP